MCALSGNLFWNTLKSWSGWMSENIFTTPYLQNKININAENQSLERNSHAALNCQTWTSYSWATVDGLIQEGMSNSIIIQQFILLHISEIHLT